MTDQPTDPLYFRSRSVINLITNNIATCDDSMLPFLKSHSLSLEYSWASGTIL